MKKFCSKCDKNKEVSDFYKDSRRKDGLRVWCKTCCNKDSAKREPDYKQKREIYREKSKTTAAKHKRQYYKENKTKILEANKAWRQSIKGRLLSYNKSARTRGIEFNLTDLQFEKFWQKPCYYCSGNIDTIGLDRLDSSLGYSLENVVSCCETCNKMKMVLGVEEFVNHIKKIHDNLFGGNFYEV